MNQLSPTWSISSIQICLDILP